VGTVAANLGIILQVVRPEGAIWAFSSHCLSFDTLTQVTLYQMFFMFIAVYILRGHIVPLLYI